MYTIDPETQDIVISGFENGIADSPYQGFTDMRNVNISSVPGEAAVNFKTVSQTPPIITGTVTSAFTTVNTGINYTGATGIENGMAIVFSSLSDTGIGLSNNTPYWVRNLGQGGAGKLGLSSDYEGNVLITMTGTALTGTFASYNIATPKYIIQQGNSVNYSATTRYYWMVDSSGQVWSNRQTTTSGYWTFTGNTTVTNGANGNGLIYYQSGTTGTPLGYVFVFRGSGIDYTRTDTASISWTYGWNPSTGTTGTAGSSPVLRSGITSGNSHEAWVMPDGRVYFCDGSNVGKFYQTNLISGPDFNPGDLTTYTYNTYPLLPLNDLAQCMAPSGTNILIGGGLNQIYSWNTTSSLINFSYLIAESNIVKMITVNTNTYIFAGNRGRIYITNGAQAQLFKKIPDHLSGTVSPYYIWGGVCSLKNKLYFGVASTSNSGTRNQFYGGVWSIDINTQALTLSNQLSYASYGGNATALFGQGNPSSTTLGQPYPTNNPAGTGLIIGWDNSFFGSVNGIDVSNTGLYTSGESYIVSDLIPIGTYLKRKTAAQVEFKLATPLLTGEKVQILVSPGLSNGTNPTFTSALTTNGDGSLISDNSQSFPIQAQQWLLVKAVLTGGSSSPSYNRLTQLRVIGMTK